MPPADTRLLYYFHGFASAIPADISTSPKISAVADFCRVTGRNFRPQNVDFRMAERRSQEVLDSVEDQAAEVVFCGASMGGWFARILQLKLLQQRPRSVVRAVAFNPAFNLAEFSHYLEGAQVNYVTGDRFEFTPADGAALVRLEESVDYRSEAPFHVYVDRDDETIDARWSETFHTPFACFHLFEGGCHRFDHAREALEDFEPGC
jgi:predicted esterase YcpF (UPF0227 family)